MKLLILTEQWKKTVLEYYFKVSKHVFIHNVKNNMEAHKELTIEY